MPSAVHSFLACVASLLIFGTVLAKDKPRSHCRWGGLSDERGRVVRCLTRAESKQLGEQPAASDRDDADEEPPKRRLPSVEVRATFQRGRTGVATQRLSGNAAAFARCVADHGGLKKARAEVRIRFQVSPAGRARDVSVSKRRFVSAAAARCIAGAIDGWFVGIPSLQPTIGTAVLRLR
jgi:hypothetical protein